MLRAINKQWQVQWAFLSGQGLKRCTRTINNKELWDRFSALTFSVKIMRYGLPFWGGDVQVYFTLDGWQGTGWSITNILYVFLYCLLGSWPWRNNSTFICLQIAKPSTNFSSKFLVLQATRVSLAKDTLWEAACAVDKCGKFYLFLWQLHNCGGYQSFTLSNI